MGKRARAMAYAELGENDGRDYDAVLARLESIFNAGSPALVAAGATWYADRHRWLQAMASIAQVDVERLAYVASALSPNTRWQRNELALLTHIRAYLRGEGQPRSETLYAANDTKAWAILNGAPYAAIGNGEKTLAFAPNLLECETLPDGMPAVTVDTIYHQAATGRVPRNGIAGGVYDTIRRATLALARKYGLAPHVFQAIVWCVYRGSAE